MLGNVAHYDSYVRVSGFVIAPLVGAILGVLALVSELEGRTVRLAWTQSISRAHWFVVKVGVGSLIVTVILVPIAVTLSWWNGAIGGNDIFGSATYPIAGWDLVAYGLFMFALTVIVGAFIRRAGWALALSIILFLAAAAMFPASVRENLVTPTVHWSQPYAAAKGQTVYAEYFPGNAWLLVNGVVPRSTVGTPTWNEVEATLPRVDSCVQSYKTKTESAYVRAERACYKRFDVENVSVYIPGNQFWTLQLREGLLYLAAGFILIGGALVLVRRIEP